MSVDPTAAVCQQKTFDALLNALPTAIVVQREKCELDCVEFCLRNNTRLQSLDPYMHSVDQTSIGQFMQAYTYSLPLEVTTAAPIAFDCVIALSSTHLMHSRHHLHQPKEGFCRSACVCVFVCVSSLSCGDSDAE